MKAAGGILLLAMLMATVASAQERSPEAWAAALPSEYMLTSGVTYHTASNIELKLDIYAPRALPSRNKVVVYYHGGGWAGGSKESAVLQLIPWLARGFTAVNVEYRGARIAPAPAAVEDCRCALLWVVVNASKYNFDPDRIVLTGDSAGSHLALMSGMLSPSDGFDRPCASAQVPEPQGSRAAPRVAAIINWSGASDVAELLDGPNARGFAINWIGSHPERLQLARRLSPLTYARPGGPAVLTIHGDADPVIPLEQAKRLHAALESHEIANELIVVPGGGHGGYPAAENRKIFAAVDRFLAKVIAPR